jgi:hypothetical protein
MYGIEFDRSLTGRGDMLVMTHVPSEGWSMDDVSVYIDQNGDVGGIRPIIAEEEFKATATTNRSS